MAKKENSQPKSIINSLSYDWNKLEIAKIGLDYTKKDPKSPLARKTLELVLRNIGVYDPAIVNTLNDPEVIGKAFQNQLAVYYEGLKTQTVKNRFDYHKKTLEMYLGDKTEKFYEKLNEFMDIKYLELEQKVLKADHVLKGAKNGINTSDEDIKKAEKTLKKYSNVYSFVSRLEDKRKNDTMNLLENSYESEQFNSFTASDDYNQAEAA